MVHSRREMKLPIDLFSYPPSSDEKELPNYLFTCMLIIAKKFVNFTHNRLQIASDKMQLIFNQKAIPVSFSHGRKNDFKNAEIMEMLY